jgi:hypothetical protein
VGPTVNYLNSLAKQLSDKHKHVNDKIKYFFTCKDVNGSSDPWVWFNSVRSNMHGIIYKRAAKRGEQIDASAHAGTCSVTVCWQGRKVELQVRRDQRNQARAAFVAMLQKELVVRGRRWPVGARPTARGAEVAEAAPTLTEAAPTLTEAPPAPAALGAGVRAGAGAEVRTGGVAGAGAGVRAGGGGGAGAGGREFR